MLITHLSYSSLNTPICMHDAHMNKLLFVFILIFISLICTASFNEPKMGRGKIFSTSFYYIYYFIVLNPRLRILKTRAISQPIRKKKSYAKNKLLFFKTLRFFYTIINCILSDIRKLSLL